MPTPHIEANKEDVAKTVIMPGDPLRAKYIAEKYLKNYKKINSVRNMLGYTGYYNDKKVTVFGSGMGMPSMGIYCYELYKEYDVDTIIRIGSCGTNNPDLKLLDIILSDNAYTESNYAYVFSNNKKHLESSNIETTNNIYNSSLKKEIKVYRGTTMTSDVFDFYVDSKKMYERVPKDIDILGTEMEAFALFHIAKELNKKAACILTVVDSKYENKSISSEEREKSLDDMIEIVLESIR